MPQLSIIIGTYNRLNTLKRCLGALLNKISTEHEIIVVDAGSTDGTRRYLQSLKNGIVVIEDGRRLGQAPSLNRVIHNLKSEYVCWLSDDNIVIEGMLDQALQILEADPDIGLLVLKTKDITGHNIHLPYIGGIRPSLILNCNQGMLKTQLFKSLGGFDENFRDYGIDSDLTAKVLLTGKKVVYTKQIAIHHYRDHETDNWIESKDRKTRKFNGRKLYNEKYANLIDWVQRDSGSVVAIEQKIYARINGFYAFCKRLRIPIEKITGYNERDWYNVLKCRFISNWDLVINMFQKYYLVQYIPLETRSKILSDKILHGV